jgi:superfamily II DNA or RNA helicase
MQDLDKLAPSFDPSQLQALQQALTSRLALVQGPPGTGKTFTGVALCDLILKHSSASIMCVCYTNHALDQFLEALLDKGIKEIVRIGSRCRSKRLEQYTLRELEAKNRGLNLTLAENRRFSILHRELEQVQDRITQLATC